MSVSRGSKLFYNSRKIIQIIILSIYNEICKSTIKYFEFIKFVTLICINFTNLIINLQRDEHQIDREKMCNSSHNRKVLGRRPMFLCKLVSIYVHQISKTTT
jgi:hypothetical protein